MTYTGFVPVDTAAVLISVLEILCSQLGCIPILCSPNVILKLLPVFQMSASTFLVFPALDTLTGRYLSVLDIGYVGNCGLAILACAWLQRLVSLLVN